MSYLIDAIILLCEMFILGLVVITSPMGLVAGTLLLANNGNVI